MSAEVDTNPPLSWMRTLASVLTSRMDIASRAGKTFGGKRDLYEVLGYQRTLTPEDYRSRFERTGVATRIVQTYPKATWRKGGLVTDELNLNPDEETDFETAWRALDDRLKIWPSFATVDTITGLGEYGLLLLGVRDGSKLDEPLLDKFKAEDLIYLSAFGQEDVEISAVSTDAEDPRFGQPIEYTLTRIGVPRGNTKARTPARSTTRVHWSRVIHVAENLLDDKIFGTPRLRNVWNYLDDLDKVEGGGAEAFWLRAHPGFRASIDKDIVLGPTDVQDLKDQMEEFANQMRRTIAQRGIDFDVMSSDVADFSSPVDKILDLISASTGIPKRILMGSERGELASTEDKSNFDDRVSDRRDNFAEPVLVRPFVDRLVAAGALPTPIDGRYEVFWPTLDTLDDNQKTTVALKLSNVNKNVDGEVFTPDEIREVTGRPPLEVIEIDEDEDDDSIPDEDFQRGQSDQESEPTTASGKDQQRAATLTLERQSSQSGKRSIVRLTHMSPE